jgi:hypothetical protein
MTTFPILRWDALIEDGSMAPKPIVYIDDVTPQTQAVLAVISDTGTEYDGKSLIASIRKPLQSQLNSSIVVLQAPWNGYPSQLGSVTLFEVTEPMKKVGGGDACDSSVDFGKVTEQTALAEAKAIEPPTLKSDNCSPSLSVSQIIGVWIVIIAIYSILSYAKGQT